MKQRQPEPWHYVPGAKITTHLGAGDDGRLITTAIEFEHDNRRCIVSRTVVPHAPAFTFRTECFTDGLEMFTHYSHRLDKAFVQARHHLFPSEEG